MRISIKRNSSHPVLAGTTLRTVEEGLGSGLQLMFVYDFSGNPLELHSFHFNSHGYFLQVAT